MSHTKESLLNLVSAYVSRYSNKSCREVERLVLEEALDDVMDDVERYQWLRYGDNDERVLIHTPYGVHLPRNERLDDAIDAFL